MLMFRTQDLHVKEIVPLLSPRAMKALSPVSEAVNATVARSRERVVRILRQEDPRLLVVIGPCSIHDEKSALEYATRLSRLQKEFADQMEIVMRVYFEKPRTTIGWKGLINDPHLDGSQDIETGLRIARKLLLGNRRPGFAGGDGISRPGGAAIHCRPHHLGGHRRAHHGIANAPRNGQRPFDARRLEERTDGSLQVAIDAMGATRHPHSFLGMNEDGVTSIVRTQGNPDAHVVLRGGRAMTNYDAASIKAAEEKLISEKLPPVLMVDCSHANSEKKFAKQEEVWRSVIEQRVGGTKSLIGLMVESHLNEGNQPIPKNLNELRYGVSITDSCIGWETTERMMRWGCETLKT